MSAARTLAVSACFFTNSRAASGTSRFWSFVNASVTGAKASLTVFSTELVSVVMWVSPSSGLSYGLTPSGLARGDLYVPQLMVRRNIDVAMRYHEFVISRFTMQSAFEAGLTPASVPHRLRQPIGFHLSQILRHIVPEHHDIVGFAGFILHMVSQQRFGLEAEALEDRDRAGLIDRHLHHE